MTEPIFLAQLKAIISYYDNSQRMAAERIPMDDSYISQLLSGRRKKVGPAYRKLIESEFNRISGKLSESNATLEHVGETPELLLPAVLREWMKRRVETGGYRDGVDYIAELIREDMRRNRADEAPVPPVPHPLNSAPDRTRPPKPTQEAP